MNNCLLNEIISDVNSERQNILIENKFKQFKLNPNFIDFENFVSLFINLCENELIKRKFIDVKYQFTDIEKDIVLLFYNLFTTTNNNNIVNNKGYCIYGEKGIGKTLLLKSIYNLHRIIAIRTNQYVPLYIPYSIDINEYNKNDLINRQTLYIEDLGREPKVNVEYGNYGSLIVEIILKRAENGTVTHCTTNANRDNLLNNLYGKTIGSRFDELFNFKEFKGIYKRNQ